MKNQRIVLLVDDDENILRGLTRRLYKQPYQIHTAKSGEEAEWILKRHTVDVVISDEYMPGITGSALLAWIAEHFPDTIRIMLTGNASLESAIKAINEGRIFQFLQKPCENEQLILSIEKAIEHRSLLMENARLLEQNRAKEAELLRIEREMGSLAKIICRDMQNPIRNAAESCLALSLQHPEFFDKNALALLDDAFAALGEMEVLVRKIAKEPPHPACV